MYDSYKPTGMLKWQLEIWLANQKCNPSPTILCAIGVAWNRRHADYSLRRNFSDREDWLLLCNWLYQQLEQRSLELENET